MSEKTKLIGVTSIFLNDSLIELRQFAREFALTKTIHYNTEYILKSKYDELSLENARLATDLAKVQAELEKAKYCQCDDPEMSVNQTCIRCCKDLK